MIVLELEVQTKSGNSVRKSIRTLYCPETAEEIPLKDYVNFHLAMKENAPECLVEAVSKKTEAEKEEFIAGWSDFDWFNYHVFIAQVCSQIIKTDGNAEGEKINVDLQSLLQMKKGSPLLPINALDNLFALYTLINDIIGGYIPVEMSHFDYAGTRFAVQDKIVDNYGRTTYAPNISTIEALEALQLEHVFSEKVEGDFVFKDRLYHTDIGVMACICRKCDKDGNIMETMPLGMQERQNFIQKRMKMFESIPMTIGLNVAFFLRSSKIILLNTRAQELRLKTSVVVSLARQEAKKLVNFGDGTHS